MSNENIVEDAELLVYKFLERKSTDYTDFVAVWNDMNFPYLFCIPELCGDKRLSNTNITHIELTHKLLQVGASFLCSEAGSEATRLAGLFFCYSVYYTQPLEVKVRIRVTLEQWSTLDQIYSQLKEKKLVQAQYLLMCLRNDAAFLVCYTSCQMFLSLRNKDQLQLSTACSPDSVSWLGGVAGQTSSLSSEYSHMKEELSLFLPQHLLEPSTLSQRIEGIMKEHPLAKSSH